MSFENTIARTALANLALALDLAAKAAKGGDPEVAARLAFEAADAFSDATAGIGGQDIIDSWEDAMDQGYDHAYEAWQPKAFAAAGGLLSDPEDYLRALVNDMPYRHYGGDPEDFKRRVSTALELYAPHFVGAFGPPMAADFAPLSGRTIVFDSWGGAYLDCLSGRRLPSFMVTALQLGEFCRMAKLAAAVAPTPSHRVRVLTSFIRTMEKASTSGVVTPEVREIAGKAAADAVAMLATINP